MVAALPLRLASFAPLCLLPPTHEQGQLALISSHLSNSLSSPLHSNMSVTQLSVGQPSPTSTLQVRLLPF